MGGVPAFMQGIQACNDKTKGKCSVPCDPSKENCEDVENAIR